MNHRSVIAAIPNYNMAPLLDSLLGQLVAMDYDAIYILDDASTDNSRVVSQKYDKVTFVSLPVNQGSSAARNQILAFIDAPCIIHFLDADVVMQSDPTKAIRNHPITNRTGFVGGLVLTEAKYQDAWNYGPRPGLMSTLTAITYGFIVRKDQGGNNNKLLRLFWNRPFGARRDKNTHPYWVIESNFFIDSETFKRFGGFDTTLREHDIQPLACKLSQAGYRNDFNSQVSVVRTDKLDVRHYNRVVALIKAEFYVIRKYIGVWRWIFSFGK